MLYISFMIYQVTIKSFLLLQTNLLKNSWWHCVVLRKQSRNCNSIGCRICTCNFETLFIVVMVTQLILLFQRCSEKLIISVLTLYLTLSMYWLVDTQLSQPLQAIGAVIRTQLELFSSFSGSSMFCTDRPGAHSFRINSEINAHAESARTGACAD